MSVYFVVSGVVYIGLKSKNHVIAQFFSGIQIRLELTRAMSDASAYRLSAKG